MSDIRDAISAGREVTAHEKNIRVNGWSDSGYVILDPKYGTGAYLIDGGANGGFALTAGNTFGNFLSMGYVGLCSGLKSIKQFKIGGAYGLALAAAYFAGIQPSWDTWTDELKGCFIGAATRALARTIAYESAYELGSNKPSIKAVVKLVVTALGIEYVSPKLDEVCNAL